MNIHQTKRIEEYELPDGRKVMRIPIDSHDYINASSNREERKWVNERQWYLMIEANGFTWIHDGMIWEG